MSKQRSGSTLQKSLLSLRNRVPRHDVITGGMYVCCTKKWVIPNLYATEYAALCAKNELLEENITVEVKRVIITITFPSTSPGESS